MKIETIEKFYNTHWILTLSDGSKILCKESYLIKLLQKESKTPSMES